MRVPRCDSSDSIDDGGGVQRANWLPNTTWVIWTKLALAMYHVLDCLLDLELVAHLVLVEQ
jgi:hypothetical protein